MKPLHGTIAVVAGGSRGAGRGIAVVLGEAGATVYVAARTSRAGPKPADNVPGTIEDTAEEITARGGTGIPVRADLADELQVKALFDRVMDEQGKLDVVANSAWDANAMNEWSRPFWKLSSALFCSTLTTIGACWWASVYAARMMSKQKRGLIAYVTDNLHPDPSAYHGQIIWDVGHQCMNRFIMGMSADAAKAGFAVMGVNPGFMRTERVRMHMANDKLKKQFRYDLSESVEYIGRAIAALARDPDVTKKNGRLLWVADLAREYGFTDIDGRVRGLFDPHAPFEAYPE